MASLLMNRLITTCRHIQSQHYSCLIQQKNLVDKLLLLQLKIYGILFLDSNFLLMFPQNGLLQKISIPPMEEINNPAPFLFMDILHKFKTSFIWFPSPFLDGRNFFYGWDMVRFWNDPINISCSSKYMTMIIQITNGQIGSFREC